MAPRRILLAVFLAAGVAAVYGRSLAGPFLYDDLWTIVRNPAVRAPAVSPTKFFTDPSTAAAPETGMGATFYRPLPALSFRANFRAAGLRPWAWRGPDLFLHALNGALLLFLLMDVLGLSAGAAAVGAAVFLFHPAQVESVVWVTQRSNLLCAAGGLAALLWAARGNAWALAAYAAALLSKETAVTLAPFLALAALRSPASPGRKKAVALGSLLLAAAFLALRGAVVGSLV
jgi:hypothetical protein